MIYFIENLNFYKNISIIKNVIPPVLVSFQSFVVSEMNGVQPSL